MSRLKVLTALLLAGLFGLLIPLSIVLAQGGGGTATVRDSDATEFSNKLSDQVWIALTDLPALAPTSAYEGWLVSDDGPQSTGILTPDADGNVSQAYWLMDSDGNPTGENLFARFHTFVISIEPVPDNNPAPSADKPYVHTIPKAAWVHIGHLAYSWKANPAYKAGNFHEGTPKGISVGLREQTWVARVHAGLSFDSGTLGAVQAHACHTVNIIEGSEGDNYDGSCGDPGDGFGVLNYAVDAANHAGFSASATPNDSVIVSNGQRVIDAAGKASTWASQGRDEALAAVASTDITAAKIHMGNAIDRLDKGMTQSTEAYVASQQMGTYTVDFAAKAPKTGDSNVPRLALLTLLVGAALLVSGTFVYRRSRATS